MTDDDATGFRPIGSILSMKGPITLQAEDGTPFTIDLHTIEPEPSGDDLLDPRITPPRAALMAALDTLSRIPQPATEMRRAEHARRERVLRRLLRWDDLREEKKQGRPWGCWCLGYGSAPRLPNKAVGDGAVSRIRRFCMCPDGVAAKAAHVAAQAERAADSESARLKRLWGNVGIPVSYEGFTLESWLQQVRSHDARAAGAAVAVVERLQTWLATPDWLYLYGEKIGRGKTALACALLIELAGDSYGDRRTVMFRTVPDLLDDFRATYNGDGDGPQDSQLMNSLIDVDVLLLDDLGKEKPSEWVRERLYRLVNRRYLAEKRTLFTSNDALESAKITDHVTEAAADRILHRCGRYGVMKLDGPNLRHRTPNDQG